MHKYSWPFPRTTKSDLIPSSVWCLNLIVQSGPHAGESLCLKFLKESSLSLDPLNLVSCELESSDLSPPHHPDPHTQSRHTLLGQASRIATGIPIPKRKRGDTLPDPQQVWNLSRHLVKIPQSRLSSIPMCKWLAMVLASWFCTVIIFFFFFSRKKMCVCSCFLLAEVWKSKDFHLLLSVPWVKLSAILQI